MSTSDQCPCCSGSPYSQCCQPFHNHTGKPATAEQLMRSRYSAFVKQLADYLITTRHPGKRHLDSLEQLNQSFANTHWLGLTILSTEKGTAKDTTGYVSFAARYQEAGKQEILHERSFFKKEVDQWYYVEADFNQGRNDPCWCGSQKKFKKCHGA